MVSAPATLVSPAPSRVLGSALAGWCGRSLAHWIPRFSTHGSAVGPDCYARVCGPGGTVSRCCPGVALSTSFPLFCGTVWRQSCFASTRSHGLVCGLAPAAIPGSGIFGGTHHHRAFWYVGSGGGMQRGALSDRLSCPRHLSLLLGISQLAAAAVTPVCLHFGTRNSQRLARLQYNCAQSDH